MRETRLIMGMPITVNIVSSSVKNSHLRKIFAYFKTIDRKYSPFKKKSDVSLINSGKLKPKKYSSEIKEIFQLCAIAKTETAGFFDAWHQGKFNPSGLVKGWAIKNAADQISKMGFSDYFVDAGGDIQTSGKNPEGQKWRVGIRNPFNRHQNVKIVELSGQGIATSGTYIRGQHVYDPHYPGREITDIVSLTVIGPDIFTADKFATAAFAMGRKGIGFIASQPGLSGYMIDAAGQAVFTPGFEEYLYA
jgi:FAD:protein FMN transferase